jgi:ribosome-associated protein
MNNDEMLQVSDTPSKTQRKKTMIALQEIGKQLTTFKPTQLNALPLSNKLRIAIEEYNRLPNSHGAKKRQLQYIGRLMRDHDLEQIENEIKKIQLPVSTRRDSDFLLDDYCALVFEGGDDGINSLLNEQQHLERQTLRKFHLEYRKNTNDPDPARLIQVRRRLLKYLKKNL